MSSAAQRTTKIKSLFKALQKRIKHPPRTSDRSVFENLIYAAVLENASYEAADSAFSVLEHHYIDWNEIRVSTASELADTFPQLPDPLAAGERVRKTLQAVFETAYVFDLEELRKKNMTQAMEHVRSISACSPFMADFTNQVALGGHVIPLDEASLRIFRLLGITQVNKDKTGEEVPALERTIPKNQGVLFASLLHQFAAEFYSDPDATEFRAILKGIDSESPKRTCEAPVFETKKPKEKPGRPQIAPPREILQKVAVEVTVEEDLDDSVENIAVEEVEFIESTPPISEENPAKQPKKPKVTSGETKQPKKRSETAPAQPSKKAAKAEIPTGTKPEKEKKVKPQTEKKAVKSERVAKPATHTPSAKKTSGKKGLPKSNPPQNKKPEAKAPAKSVKKSVPCTKPPKKAPPKTTTGKAGKNNEKASPTRTLRQKKPK